MNYQETDRTCSGCGATASDRANNKPGEPQGLEECPHCGGQKCCMCDLGDDTSCISCDGEDLE